MQRPPTTRRQAGRLVVGTCFPIKGVNTGSQPTTMIVDVNAEDTTLQVEVSAEHIMCRSVANAVRLAELADEVEAIEHPSAKSQELQAPDRFRLCASSSSRCGWWWSLAAAGPF